LTSKVEIENGGVTHNFESVPPKELSDTILKWDYPRTIPAKFALIWFSGFREEDLNVIFYQNMPNLHNLYKSAERKIPQKNPDCM
jgi:hypothetical protein